VTLPSRPTVDGAALRARLTATARTHAGDPVRQRAEAVPILKQALWSARADARGWLDAGASGLRVARFLSRATDEVVAALVDFTTTHVIRARNPTEGERFALVAVGGYGRGVLAPYSDVDVMLLRAWKLTPHTESVAEYLLYALWDVGLKVGWAARSVDECLRVAREDMTVRTTLLEARLIAGDAALLEIMASRFREEVARGSEAEFVAAKLRERDERHARAGASRYLVEPDVKNGKGGLRDLHTLFWIARYLRPETTSTTDAAEQMFSPEEGRAFVRAFSFLWTVRCRLHFAAGRAEERLGFAWQPQLAREMGYRDRRGRPAVERFMRRYFFAAREAGVLTRTLCARLEGEQALARPRGLSRFLRRPSFRMPLRDRAFQVRGGRLRLRRADAFERDPADLIRLFRAADRHDLDLAPEAFDAVRRAGRAAVRARGDRKAAAAFVELLARGRDPRRALTLMNEAGLLGRYLPEFGRIVARTQFNMYHAYTTDEHTLRAVGVVREVADGRTGEDAGAPAAFRALEDPDVVFLAMLLHDTGKGSGEAQEVAGERFARDACGRLGLTAERVEAAAWLVRNHLLMNEVAQKRDLSDPETVAGFAQAVGGAERLRGLLVVTVADIQAVGPGVWNGWKARLLRQLYEATEAVLKGGAAMEAARPAGDRAALLAAVPEAAAWAEGLDDDYLAAFSAEEQAAHARLALAGPAGAAATVRSERQVTELAVIAPDRLGLFADLAAAVVASGGDVVEARVHTSAAGQALDVFYLQDGTGRAFGEGREAALRALERRVVAAAAGGAVGGATPSRPVGRATAFAVAASVIVEDLGPERGVRVEASGADRPGLLADIARAVSRTGLSIRSAHVDTEGERAVDVLYVRRADGGGLIKPGQLSRLKTALTAVFEPAATERSLAPERGAA